MSLVCYGSSGESSDEDCEADLTTKGQTAEVVRNNYNPENVADNSQDHHIVPSKRLNTGSDDAIVKSQENHVSINAYRTQVEQARSAKISNKKKSLRDKIKSDLLKNIPFPKRKDSKEPVLIAIPTLNDCEDEEFVDSSPKKKRLKSSQKSGLFSVLPQPKNTAISSKELNRPLIPHSVSKSKSILESSKSLSQKSIEKYAKTISSEDDDIKSNYFLLSEEKDVSIGPHVSATPTISVSNKTYAPQHTVVCSSSCPDGVQNICQYEHEQTSYSYSNPCPTVRQDCSAIETLQTGLENDVEVAGSIEDPMQDEKFLRMMGKKKGEAIEFIDINASDQLPKPGEWQTKSLTEEQPVSSKKNPNQPNSLQRRKHQITYLAFQAKQRELELKNNWAQNRMTRKQTQAKYGF